MVDPTTVDETIQILKNIKHKYEEHHGVHYSDEAIVSAVRLSDRYITDRNLPDKAIDVMDEAGARVHLANIVVPKEILHLEEEIEKIKQSKNQVVKNQNFEEAARLRDLEKKLLSDLEIAKREWELKAQDTVYQVSEENVSNVVAMMTGIPVNKIAESESEKLLKMDTVLRTQIIGQDEALSQLTKAIRRTRAGLKQSAATDRLVHFPRPDRRRQNRNGESPCPLSVRFGGCLDWRLRAWRVHGKIFRVALRDGLQPRDVATHFAHPRRVFQLAGGALEAQVELLLLELEHFGVDLVGRHRPDIG